MTITETIMGLLASPAGVETCEVPGADIKQAGRILTKLVANGQAFPVRITHKRTRYFGTKLEADVFREHLPVKAAARKQAGARQQGPAKLPGAPIEPEGVKKTVVPAPPPRFQVVDLPTMRPPITRRDGEEFRKWQRPGRW